VANRTGLDFLDFLDFLDSDSDSDFDFDFDNDLTGRQPLPGGDA